MPRSTVPFEFPDEDLERVRLLAYSLRASITFGDITPATRAVVNQFMARPGVWDLFFQQTATITAHSKVVRWEERPAYWRFREALEAGQQDTAAFVLWAGAQSNNDTRGAYASH